jgi:hypothetical protein
MDADLLGCNVIEIPNGGWAQRVTAQSDKELDAG